MKNILVIDRYQPNFDAYRLLLNHLCEKEFGVEATVFCTNSPEEGKKYFDTHRTQLDFVLVGSIARHLVPSLKTAFDPKPIFGMASLRDDRVILFNAGCARAFDKITVYSQLRSYFRAPSQSAKAEAALV